jgi:hypothetical protein
MRIIVPHNKGREEAKRRIDEAIDRMLASSFPGLQLLDAQKNWEGSTLNLSLRVGAGFVNVPVTAQAQAEETQVVIDCDLPPIVKQFVPEEKIRADFETRIRGLLS